MKPFTLVYVGPDDTLVVEHVEAKDADAAIEQSAAEPALPEDLDFAVFAGHLYDIGPHCEP